MKAVVVTAAVALLVGAAIRIGLGASVMGEVMLMLLVVLPVVGLVVTIDDDLPGGFSNLDGKRRAPWRFWENWADLAIRTGLCGLGFAIDAGWRTSSSTTGWIFGLASIVALMAFGKRVYRSA